MFHPMKPETLARRAVRAERDRQDRANDLFARLAEKAGDDPEGPNGIWAETLAEHIEKHGPPTGAR